MSTPRTCARRMVTVTLHSQKRTYSAPADNAFPPNKVKYIPTSGTYPKGFFVGSAHAQVKQSNTKFDDLALVASEKPCHVAVVNTRNAFRAAPVQLNNIIVHGSYASNIRGLVINSGCANAVTGTQGRRDAIKMSLTTDEALAQRFPQPNHKPKPDMDIEDPRFSQSLRTLVMSTGVIGQNLPIDRITNKIPNLVESLGDSHDHWLRAARAICTTDTFPKLISRQYTLPGYPGVTFSIAGMTKGAGMIAPNMATLLGAICTDAPVTHQALKTILVDGTQSSFNAITIDGDTSTNDSVALFANGMAVPQDDPRRIHYEMPQQETEQGDQSKSLREAMSTTKTKQSADFVALSKVVSEFMQDLAKLVVRDGEGATKFVTIRVENAVNKPVAESVAKSIANSALVKTALYGKDANWGRILCAIGYAPRANPKGNGIKPEQTSVSFIPSDGSEELKLLVNGEPQGVNEERAKAILELEDLEILVSLSTPGNAKRTAKAVVYTCDFSHEYVTINGDYRT